MNNIFWKNDISILFNDNNYINFIPQKDCSLNENLNRITRLAFYYFFILYLYNDDLLNNFIGFLLICIICICIYNNYSIIERFTLKTDNKKNNLILDDNLKLDNNIKRKSTLNNPMMNLSVYDLGKKTHRANLDDKNIDKNLLKNVDDKNHKNILNNDTNLFKRQFYTMPINSNPDNRHEFLEFLKKETICKEDTTKCVNRITNRLDYGTIKQ